MAEKRPDLPTGPVIDPETGEMTAPWRQYFAEVNRLIRVILDNAGL